MPSDYTSPAVQFEWPQSWNSSTKRCIPASAGHLNTMMRDIHAELETGLELEASQLGEVARYYFDGTGKAVRPVIAVCLGKAALETTGCSTNSEVEGKQRQVALVSEMIHTASLLHDDILDHAHSRRGKPSVNSNWDARKSTFAGCRGLHPGSWVKANG